MNRGSMKKNREQRARVNIISTLLRQLVSTFCGIVIPRVMIGAFGSVVYGATTSIAQFLSYIALLEGGIGRVARGALYRPLAKHDNEQISRVYQAVRRFFRKIGICLLLYTLVVALFYHDIADITVFSRTFTFGLVIAISLSTFATYMGGLADMTLLHADQKQYLTNTIIMVTNVVNTLAIVMLVWLDANVLVVKLASSLVFITRPLLYSHYVKKDYALTKLPPDPKALSQKWTGLGQHIAYFLHTNTDVILLTLFADLKYVAVYSVYHLVINSIWNIASSFSGGMESAFGEMIANGEKEELQAAYGRYKAMLSMVTILLFGSAAVLLIPFVRLYMAGVTDADYIQPLFGILLLLAEAMNCLALPCCSLPIAANKLKQTRWGSYAEALINIVVSCSLIKWNPLLGVALGTLCATGFKCAYYIIYAARNLLHCSAAKMLGKFGISMLMLLLIHYAGQAVFEHVPINNYFVWCLWGVVVFISVGVIAVLACRLIFPKETKRLINAATCKLKQAAK